MLGNSSDNSTTQSSPLSQTGIAIIAAISSFLLLGLFVTLIVLLHFKKRGEKISQVEKIKVRESNVLKDSDTKAGPSSKIHLADENDQKEWENKFQAYLK